jgi:DNA helicase HerA-like ATPase
MPKEENALIIARGAAPVGILPGMANRHGLIAGATGTGKTVTLRVLAEHFSSIGVPVFMADVKGDLSGIAVSGGENPRIAERVTELGLAEFHYRGFPVLFWDVFGEQGHPVRTTISEMGPLLLARILDLNDTQSDVLAMIFRVADEQGLLLLDGKDLRAMVQYAADHAAELRTKYGNISPATVGAIQRSLLVLEDQGGARFFGEPALDVGAFIRNREGQGVINILAADRLLQSPRLYSSFLLWLLSELYEQLPEVGDLEKPKLLFFFDEAHLLFADAPKALVEKVILVVRLIRSKGVGVYFVTQNPLDLPDDVLGQLGNRVQHALRAFTPKDQKAVRAAAETMRKNPAFETETVITELRTGEALVSFLDGRGAPGVTERALIYPPESRLAPLTADERGTLVRASPLFGSYETMVDRRSAYEMLAQRAVPEAPAETKTEKRQKTTPPTRGKSTGRMIGDMAGSAARSAGTQIGREIIRGILGSLSKK